MCQMGKSGMYHRVQCETAWGFPDVTLREEKPCARPYSLLILHIGKMGMWPGVGCEAGQQFPDVTHKDLKVSGRVFFFPMYQMWNKMCVEVRLGS